MPKMKVSVAAPSRSQQEDWEAQDALRTLQRADQIRGDRKMMARAQREAQRQMASLHRVSKPSPKGTARKTTAARKPVASRTGGK